MNDERTPAIRYPDNFTGNWDDYDEYGERLINENDYDEYGVLLVDEADELAAEFFDEYEPEVWE